MRVISALSEISQTLNQAKNTHSSIGLVPTMGALHPGHIKLIEKSKEDNDFNIVSIFVNPIQFDNRDDYESYPRDLDSDIDLLQKVGVDVVFAPKEKDIYPAKPLVSVDFGKMSTVMEGKFRTGHFEGVGVIVSKLFHLTQPTSAYFGLKDLQQFLLIKRMCFDLNFTVKIIGVETQRESSGLAMSSRNQRLSNDGLKIAAHLYQGIKQVEQLLWEKSDLKNILNSVHAYYDKVEGLEIEYLEVVDATTLEEASSNNLPNELAVCVAGYVEGVRLIDNLYLRLK